VEGIGQSTLRSDVIDLGLGHPDPDLLPVEGLRRAAAAAFDRYGTDVLSYGAAAGPPPTIAFICGRLALVDGRAPTPAEVVVTAGNSHGLEQVLTMTAKPGDTVLVESPTYHLALRILRDHPVDVVPIPSDEGGMRVSEIGPTIARLRRSGARPTLLYTVPTFNNPTGISLAPERRRDLVALAATEGFTIVEDDVYRELAYTAKAPPSLWSIAEPGTVIRLGSFSKSLSPGLRVGYMTADEATANTSVEGGLLESGGGISHFASLVVAEFAATGEYDATVTHLREVYAARRDALTLALLAEMSDVADWVAPDGGYFVWVTLRTPTDIGALHAAAERHGTSFVPGNVFYADGSGGRASLRLAFSRYPPEVLAEGVRRLASAVRQQAVT
jgi:2-aminoadipate transaminase